MNVSEKINSIIAEGMLDNQFMAAQRQNYALEVKLKEMQKELLIKTSKAEAIREFADRLKERARNLPEYDEGGWECRISVVEVEDIDKLVKEMTEGDNG